VVNNHTSLGPGWGVWGNTLWGVPRTGGLVRNGLGTMIGLNPSRPGVPPPSDDTTVRIPRHHAAPLGIHRAPPPINTVREDARSWEIPSPASSPTRVGIWGVPPPIFFQYNLIKLRMDGFRLHLKWATAENMRNKIREKYHPCRTSNVDDPAKNRHERTTIERVTFDFRTGAERALPAHRAD